MKNKFNISFFFGVLLLIVISYQIVDNLVHTNNPQNTMELSEWDDELEEDAFDDFLFVVFNANVSAVQVHTVLCEINGIPLSNLPSVHLKIPSPPPELA